MRTIVKAVALTALLAFAAGFAAGWAWRRHTHPTAAEGFEAATKGLFGK